MGKHDSSFFMNRRELLGAGVAASLGIGTGGLSATRALAQESFTWITSYGIIISFAPELVAQAGGYWKEQGLDGTIYGGSGSAAALQQVLGGQALVCRAPAVDIIKAVAAEGAPIISYATLGQANSFYVISKEGQAIESPADMVGKTIGVASRGGGTENILDAMLALAGIELDAVKREVAGASVGAWGLLQAGRIDGFVTTIGALSALRENGESIVYWNTDKFAPMPGQCYVTLRETVEKRPETLAKIIRGIHRSIEFILADEQLDETFKLLSQFDVAELADPASAKAALRMEFELWNLEGAENRLRNMSGRWESAVDVMERSGLIQSGVSVPLFTNEIVDRARG